MFLWKVGLCFFFLDQIIIFVSRNKWNTFMNFDICEKFCVHLLDI